MKGAPQLGSLYGLEDLVEPTEEPKTLKNHEVMNCQKLPCTLRQTKFTGRVWSSNLRGISERYTLLKAKVLESRPWGG